MSISPPSDIILDVARAADPEKYRVAADRLAKLGSTSSVAKADFASVIGALSGTQVPTQSADITAQSLGVTDRMARAEWHSNKLAGGPASVEKAQRDLEGFLLQNMVESMLPKDSGGLYGGGVAGGMWRSMLAEQIGTQLARAGGIGIAAHAFKAHPISAGASVSHNALAISLNSRKTFTLPTDTSGFNFPVLSKKT